MSFKSFLLDKKEGIMTITLNRPRVLNALDDPTLLELRDIMQSAKHDEEIGIVLFTGTGRAFCVGSDLKYQPRPNDPPGYHHILGQEVLDMIENLPKPVIAVVNGFCLGGGMEMLLTFDLRLAADDATFGLPEINLGAIPSWGGTQRLSRQIGTIKAKELMFTGDFIDAQEALKIGLINRVVPKTRLMETALELAQKLIAKNPVSMERIKFLANKAIDLPVELGSKLALTSFGVSGTIRPPEEGTSIYEAMTRLRAKYSKSE